MAVFNEEKFLEKCFSALMKQTLKPNQVIIVNDGSTDKSGEIIAKYSFQAIELPAKKEPNLERYPCVLSIGSKLLQEDFEYIGILDADTVLEPDYYKKLVERLEKDDRIGIAGGELKNQQSTGPILGLIPYVYGCNRLYSRKCWLALNDGKIMKPIPQIDFYHNIYAKMIGFKPERFNDILSWALRPPGGLGNAFVKGYHAYELGYYWHYLFLRALRNHKLAMISGYLKARFSNRPEYPIKTYVRQMQVFRLKRLFCGG